MKDGNELVLPGDLRYTASHEWLTTAAPFRLGITDFAQDQLGDVTYVDLPEVGATFARESEFGSVESIKSVASLYLPTDAKVTDVNPLLADDPGLVNRDPYGEGWLIEIEPLTEADVAGLLPAESYAALLKEQA